MAYVRYAGKARRSEGLSYVDPVLKKKADAMLTSSIKKPIKTWSRRCSIHPDWIGLTFSVHNGKTFIDVHITDDMINHKLGEFAPTRTWKGHSSNNKAADSKSAATSSPSKEVKKK